MKWFSVLVSLSLLVCNTAALANYTLVLSQSQHLNESRERALLASGIVPFSCELVNQLGTYVVRCGKHPDKNYFDPFVQQLNKLDIYSKIEGYQEVPILFRFEPITLGEETQMFLEKLAQQALQIKTRKTAHKPVQSIDSQWDKEQFRQGLYFIDRGWAAYRNNEYALASSLFALAKQIPKLALAADHGQALTHVALNEKNEALNLLWPLYQAGFNREQVLPSVLSLANELGRTELIAELLPQLSVEEQARWQLIALEAELKQRVKQRKINFSMLMEDYAPLLERCYGFETVLNAVKQFSKIANQLSATEKLVMSCAKDEEQLALAYLNSNFLKKDANYLTAHHTFGKHKKLISDNKIKQQINRIQFDTLMHIVSLDSTTSEGKLEIYQFMAKRWPRNTALKFATAWHYYNTSHFNSALFLFDEIYQIKPNSEAAKGIVLSTLALGDNQKALLLAKEMGDKTLYLSALKKELSNHPIPSLAAYEAANEILTLDPHYIAAYSAKAWYLFEQDRVSEAFVVFETWFELAPETEDALLGQVLCLQRLKDETQLLALIEKYPKYQNKIYEGLAQHYFEQGEFEKANVYFKKLAQDKTLDEEQQAVYAWSLSNAKYYDESNVIFKNLLSKNDDPSALTGLIINYQAEGKTSEIERLKQNYATNPTYKAIFAQFGFGETQWLSFATDVALENENAATSLLHLNKPAVWYRVESINKKGDEGSSKLGLLSQQLGGSISFNKHQVNIGLQNYRLDSGNITSTANLGSNYINKAINVISSRDSDTFWLAQYHYQGEQRWTLTLAEAPKIEQIDKNYHWLLQWQYTDYKVKLFDKPVYESKLALVGEIDLYTGQAFGKVHDKGLEVALSKNLTAAWNANLLASYSELEGTNVIDNSRINVNISAATNTQFKRNELVYGGFANWQQYKHNSNAFYLGHGGYFSPQSLAVVGAFGRYHQYNQVDWWFIDASLSYFDYSTDDIAQYPLTNRPDIILGESNNGVGVNFSLEKHWLLGQHFELGIGAQYQVSPGFDFYRFGINLRYLFAKRQNVWPRQHALSQESLFQSYSPWLEMK
ncbi:cellulose synthase subunit BcsC-related outer membrane protein [Pseudoalteromonas sp. G4]|uniref:cellulose synthase subunit BcsC-related outer membrane protein n=1 Tax=Pseudoalteromonas sp. G4 TaxID=2992761 RepID=UPI00237E5C07|nr:cellulose synthase subunit BcsC-related outer membrane protein [Pseudoalteromonas sp. G4]MDE3270405.1 cellulose synthase subunit BcsC-related outer membrane protein [Pseudoalteromonas sp. G4]